MELLQEMVLPKSGIVARLREYQHVKSGIEIGHERRNR
jgi:hypothetical protein